LVVDDTMSIADRTKEGAMDSPTLVSPSSFCWNPSCPAYGQVDLSNIRKFGRTPAPIQRYQCTTCRRTFVETIGTVFYGRRRSQETIIECLALLAERNSLAAIHRVKGVKEETVMAWLRIAAAHVEQIEALLLATYKLTRAQLDAMWAYVGNKAELGAQPTPTNVAPSGVA
jgi:transposase-like protein